MEIFGIPTNYFTIILSVIAVIIPIITYFTQRKKKQMVYRVKSFVSLIKVKDIISSELKIKYKEKIVNSLQLIQIEFINIGNESITEKAFKKPIILTFGETSEVFTLEITSTVPKSLDVNARIIENNRITIEPLLLNKGERFSIKILVSKVEKFEIESRFEGMPEISEINVKKNLILIGSLFATFWILMITSLIIDSPFELPLIITAFVAIFLAMLVTYKTPTSEKMF